MCYHLFLNHVTYLYVYTFHALFHISIVEAVNVLNVMIIRKTSGAMEE
jgi:hypothetical protein